MSYLRVGWIQCSFIEMNKNAFELQSLTLVDTPLVPINWVPEDFDGIDVFLPDPGPHVVVIDFCVDVKLSELRGFMEIQSLKPIHTLNIKRARSDVSLRNKGKPLLFAARHAERIRFIVMHFYPNYAFLEWLHDDIDVRITGYRCVFAQD